MSQTIYQPKPGHTWNPLTRYRNIICPCGSGRKAKRCHGAAEIVPEKEAVAVQAFLIEMAKTGIIKLRKGDVR